MTRPLTWLFTAAFALCTGCAGGPKWELKDPGPLPAEQRAILVAAEKHYRKGEPFVQLRQQIVADPVAAWWWTRMVVRDVVSVREGKVASAEQGSTFGEELGQRIREGRADTDDGAALLRATAGKKDPVEARALGELHELGVAAVPCLIVDLARHPQGFNRQLGVDLLARIGEAALPMVAQQLAASEDPAQRRTAADACADMFVRQGVLLDGAISQLLRLATDDDYGVRAAACAGLAHGGDVGTVTLLRVVRTDADAFVRRSAARALGQHRSAATAAMLCDYLQRCQTEHDTKGCEAAQMALQEHARTRGVRSLEAWRTYAATLAAAAKPGSARAVGR
jgi:hypothetical protein